MCRGYMLEVRLFRMLTTVSEVISVVLFTACCYANPFLDIKVFLMVNCRVYIRPGAGVTACGSLQKACYRMLSE